MSDYKQEVRFGANVDPTASDPSWPLRLTHAIERAGLEYIGIQDHPYNSGFLETWTLIATLLQATERVHIFPNVANLPLRPPVMLAKAAATLDVHSGGRVELGLGAAKASRSRSWKRPFRSYMRSGAALTLCALRVSTTLSKTRIRGHARLTPSASG